jgi:hypothetical protein
MRNFGSSFFLLILLCGSAAVGFFANSRLPERHRTLDSIELVRLAISLLVTFTAIVLGLLTTSVKSGFDVAYGARGAYAGQLAQFDRCLRDYGAETQQMRAQLRGYVAAAIVSTWPFEPPPTGVTYPDTSNIPLTGESSILAALIDKIGYELHSLQPADELHRSLMSACAQQYAELLRRRWTVIEGIRTSISTPFYWVLVFWLIILFGSFGLRAPQQHERHRHRPMRNFRDHSHVRHSRYGSALWRHVRYTQHIDAQCACRYGAVTAAPHNSA